jgi:hypothetical protein
MKFYSFPRYQGGFTILEVMLSVTILTMVVYSLFIVFDRSMLVIDKIFVNAHKYEVLKNFFENLRKELNSSVANKPGELYRFRGGPHWIEFATPVIQSTDINEYIKLGINQLTAEYHKIQYFGARPDSDTTLPKWSKDPPYIFYQLPIFRMEANPSSPEGDPHKSFLAFIDDKEGLQFEKDPEINPVVNHWYEKPKGRETVHDWNAKDGENSELLKPYYTIQKIMDARYLKFRYFYTVHYKENILPPPEKFKLKEYSQDWWDSAIRYPTNSSNENENFKSFYNNSIYTGNADLKAIERERNNRYSTGGKFNENLAYQNEPDVFRAFAAEKWDEKFKLSKYDNVFYQSLVLGAELKQDPWLTIVPSSVEVSVTLFDRHKGLEALNMTEEENRNLYRGETFVMRIFLRAHSPSVTNYQSGLLNE